MILFDYWLDNNDRHIWTQDKQNLIIAGGPEPKLWMIDQANVFNGPHWNSETLLNKMNNYKAFGERFINASSLLLMVPTLFANRYPSCIP